MVSVFAVSVVRLAPPVYLGLERLDLRVDGRAALLELGQARLVALLELGQACFVGGRGQGRRRVGEEELGAARVDVGCRRQPEPVRTSKFRGRSASGRIDARRHFLESRREGAELVTTRPT